MAGRPNLLRLPYLGPYSVNTPYSRRIHVEPRIHCIIRVFKTALARGYDPSAGKHASCRLARLARAAAARVGEFISVGARRPVGSTAAGSAAVGAAAAAGSVMWSGTWTTGPEYGMSSMPRHTTPAYFPYPRPYSRRIHARVRIHCHCIIRVFKMINLRSSVIIM